MNPRLGRNGLDRSLQYAIGLRPERKLPVPETPGPASYSPHEFQLKNRTRAPCFSIGLKTKIKNARDAVPGPQDYSPVKRDQAKSPAYSFGVQTPKGVSRLTE